MNAFLPFLERFTKLYVNAFLPFLERFTKLYVNAFLPFLQRFQVSCERGCRKPVCDHTIKQSCLNRVFQSERRCGGQSNSSLVQSLSEEVNMEVKKLTGAPRGSLFASLLFLRTSDRYRGRS